MLCSSVAALYVLLAVPGHHGHLSPVRERVRGAAKRTVKAGAKRMWSAIVPVKVLAVLSMESRAENAAIRPVHHLA
jgi:hypothetical protein